jgi:hypothetical protein
MTSKKRNAMPWDLLNPNRKHVPEDVYSDRLDICKSCEFLIKPTNQCSKCLCFMNLKCALAFAFCPENKWDAYVEEENK